MERINIANWTSDQGVDEVIQSEDPESGAIGLVVNNPYKFIRNATRIQGFGLKAAVATMCIVDMQREEMEQAGACAAVCDIPLNAVDVSRQG